MFRFNDDVTITIAYKDKRLQHMCSKDELTEIAMDHRSFIAVVVKNMFDKIESYYHKQESKTNGT